MIATFRFDVKVKRLVACGVAWFPAMIQIVHFIAKRYSMTRFPHALFPIQLTGTARGAGTSAGQQQITPDDKFLSISGDGVAITVETDHLIPFGLVLRNDFKACDRHPEINKNSPVPPNLRFHDTHKTIWGLIRALSRPEALHSKVERSQIIKVERGLRRLYNAEIILPNFPNPGNATAWRTYTEGIAAILGNVKDQRKVDAVNELLRLAKVEPNLRRVALMIYMVERLLAERSDAMERIDIAVSYRMYHTIRLLNDIQKYVKETQRVARQCLSPSSPILGPSPNRKRQLNGVRYWRNHAEELETCVVQPFRDQFKPLAVCFRKAADSMEENEIPTVRKQMELVVAICEVMDLRMDVEGVLSTVAELKAVTERKSENARTFETPEHQILWNQANASWVLSQLQALEAMVVSVISHAEVLHHAPVLNKVLNNVRYAIELVDTTGSPTNAYESLESASKQLDKPAVLPD